MSLSIKFMSEMLKGCKVCGEGIGRQLIIKL